MTLKELFNRCDFKDIAPVIKEHHYSDKAINMSHFKEAFDVLRHLEPKLNPDYPSYQKVTITTARNANWEKKEKKNNDYIRAMCGGDYWESDLAKEVVVSGEITLTDNEVAAHCLWEMTFYGNPYNREESEEVSLRISGETDTSNPYTVAADKLEDKLHKKYLPRRYKYATNYANHQEFLKGKNGKPTQYFKYIPDELMWVEPRKNRAKRMRDHRLEQRIKKLERMAKIEYAIRRLTANTKSFARKEVEYLFKTNLIREGRFHSFAYNPDQRIDYLIDLLSNYVSEDFSNYTHFILMFRTSSVYPLDQRELDMIQVFFSKYLPASANIRYGYGNDEN